MNAIGTFRIHRVALMVCAVLCFGCGDSGDEAPDGAVDTGATDTTSEVFIPPASDADTPDTGTTDAAGTDATPPPDTGMPDITAPEDTAVDTATPPDLCAEVDCLENASHCVLSMTCDPATGECTVKETADAGSDCNDDDDVCTQGECDDAGACVTVGSPNDCATEQSAEPCWVFACDPQNGCQKTTPAADSPCDDNNECTAGDTCITDANGVLSCAGTPIEADDGNDCTKDSCTDGALVNEPLTNTPCALAGSMAANGTCNNGVCEDSGICACGSDADCNNGDLCLNVKCENCTCIMQDEDPCDDGQVCTIDVCDSNTGCDNILDTTNFCWIVGTGCVDNGTASPNNPCLSCDPSKAVIVWTPNDGASCDDGDPNTCNDTCSAKQCIGGTCP